MPRGSVGCRSHQTPCAQSHPKRQSPVHWPPASHPASMDAITDDDEDTIPSFDSDTAGASCKTNDDIAASIHVIGQVAAISSMNTVFYLQMILLVLNYLPALKKRKGTKRKREANLRRDRRSVIEFVHGWDDDMFKRQFRLSCEDF